MPAIHPVRLKIRVAQLSEKLHQPIAFLRLLHQLLDEYADRTYRPGQSGAPPALLATYKTPTPVFRQIDREIAPIALSDPAAALALVDSLWSEPVIEFRLLATSLLGKIKPEPSNLVTERVQTWISSKPEDQIEEAILGHGLRRFRCDFPNSYLEMVEEWLKADQTHLRQAGLRALLPLLDDHDFKDLPAVLSILSPYIRNPARYMRHELVTVLRVFAHRSPQEAVYILRQSLSPEATGTAWLARQVLNDLPPEAQNNLREALHLQSKP